MQVSQELMHSIGVDIGGTFTDAIVVDDAGEVTIGKAPSTPPDFDQGFIDALTSAAERRGTTLEDLIARAHGIYHGCTVGTNALVEDRTAKVGLLTTRGMRDSIFTMQAGGRHWGSAPEEIAHVGRHSKPSPLVDKHHIEEIDERVTFDGEVLVELNVERARESIQRLLDKGVESFAISLLWSVANPAHEQALKGLVNEIAPGAFVSVGADVVARRGEYERTVATVINALIGPVMDTYLGNLTEKLSGYGYSKSLYVMNCSGGVIHADLARALPLLTIGSGPVAGVIGAGSLSRMEAEVTSRGAGAANVISADMGGTTFDVGVIRAGEPLSRQTTRHQQYEYFVPTLDVRSVGSGGGSIVWFDPASGTLRVGPGSAGANPGPAAYQRGGTEPTVADADLVLGYLNPDFFLGGEITLSMEAAVEALARVGEPLGFDALETAAAAARIVDSQMADAIRLASVQQGYDPREHEMYAYGGAGPVHATSLARDLGVKRIVVPLADLAAGWSAFGVVSSDALVVEEQAKLLNQPFDPAELSAIWEDLDRRTDDRMVAQGIGVDELVKDRFVEMRHAAQINTVPIKAPVGDYDESTIEELISAFDAEYARLFGESGYAEAGYAMTAMRVRARASKAQLTIRPNGNDAGAVDSATAVKGERGVVFFENGLERVATPIYDGALFTAGMSIEGPAIVEFTDTTVVVRFGQRASLDEMGSIAIDLGE
jgi:N-methylhydantoinase A